MTPSEQNVDETGRVGVAETGSTRFAPEAAARLRPTGDDPARGDMLPMELPRDPERTFTATELIRAADNEDVRLALQAAKGVFPGDVWGAGAEGEYAWLAGVAALLGAPEIGDKIQEARRTENWFNGRHGAAAEGITGRVPKRILSEFGLSRFLRREAK